MQRTPRGGSAARAIALLTFALSLSGWAAVASARTIAVPGQYPSIKGALIAARAGDIVLVGCGTYLESDIQVKSGVSLWSGTLQPECVTIDAGEAGRCLLFVDADSTTSVVGFTLRGGRATGPAASRSGGAVLSIDSSPRLTRCIFTDNAANDGGAVACTGRGSPRFEQCRFTGNSAARNGGAVVWATPAGAIVNSVLAENQALSGGGAILVTGGRLQVSHCLLQDNAAGNTGGALLVANATANLVTSVLVHNAGGLAGGAVASFTADITFTNCTLAANAADGAGTALSGNQTHSTLVRSLVADSTSPVLAFANGDPIISQSNILVLDTGGWPDSLPDQRNREGNMSADPRFCAPETRDYHLQPGSPCLLDASQAAIGALGPGCGTRFPPDMLD